LNPSNPVIPESSGIRSYNDPMSAPIRVTLNGAPREFPAALTLEQLLGELALAGRRLAVERNGEIVPRSRFAEARLADGDRIEVVIAVGGG
jgi:sulfur carrier protein